MASLKKRLTLFLLAGLGSLILLGGAILYPAVRNVTIAEFDHAHAAKLKALTTLPEPEREGINLAFIESHFSEYNPGTEAEYFQVWLPDGTSIGRSPSLGTNDLHPRFGSEQSPAFFPISLPDGRPGRAVGIGFKTDRFNKGSIPDPNDEDFTVGIVLARATDQLDDLLRGLLTGMLLGFTALLFLGVWIVQAATRRGLRPVQDLTQELAEIDVHSLKKTLPTAAYPVELQPIVVQVNMLTQRLGAGLERERRFAANAAHELLTPVAELRAMAEAAQRWSGDPEATRDLAADTLDTARQMEHLVRNLLALERAQTSQATVRLESLPIQAVQLEVAEMLGTRPQEKKLNLQYRVPPDLVTVADHVLLKAILFNLLDNAVEYTPPGGNITLEASYPPAGPLITIQNSTLNLTEQDLAHFFEPLWRKDKARTTRAHAGLGLALSKTFAEAIHADLTAQLLAPDLLQFSLHFKKRA